MSNPKTRAEREQRLREQLAKFAELQMQVNFLAQQLRHYEAMIMGAAEAIGKLLSPIDGVLNQLEKVPKGVKDPVLHAFILHLKQEREKLMQQEVQLNAVAADPPIMGGRLPKAPLAPTPEQARAAEAAGEVAAGAQDPPLED